jgi:putative phosphoesterase
VGAAPGAVTRVAVISDTHLPRGARRLPDACVAELRAAGLILHAGDVSTAAALAELRALGPPLEAVRGNVDDGELRAALPERRVVEVEAARIGLVHVPGPAAGREERLVRWFPDCGAVVYGHTHRPQVARHGGCWILNPGSPTERRRAPHHTMIVLEVDGAVVQPTLLELT